VSQETQRTVDEEVRRIVDEAHRAVTQLLTEHREKLDSLTERLIEKETLDQDEAYEAANVPLPEPAGEAPEPATY
jgi:cell division protease FtsH